MESMTSGFAELVKTHLPVENEKEETVGIFLGKKRNNSVLPGRMDIIKALAKEIPDKAKFPYKVDLKNPSKGIVVEIIKVTFTNFRIPQSP